MDILTVKNLKKRFGPAAGGFTAVNDITFSLKEGEILGLLGPNGAGKTTTIQMLLGVLTPTAGEVRYFGKNLWRHSEEILEKVNFSSTYTQLPWRLTVRENLTYSSYLYDIKNRKERLKKLIDIFRLGRFVDDQMEDLSSGEVTRVNLAKAFINYPKVLLLDEPTASMDPETSDYIRKFLLKQRRLFNVSIIWTSHNMAEVEEVCDRVIFINRGKIIADDTPERLAKTIEICHVALSVPDGLKRTIEICKNKNIRYRLSARNIVVDLKEKDIPVFLREIMDRGVSYDQISIDKPTLKDYFLQVAPVRKNEI